jgi:anti-anti-sigma factor
MDGGRSFDGGLTFEGGLSFEVDREPAIVLLRVSGVLDPYTAPELRRAVLNCVAEQSPAVVVDASALAVADEVGLTVLAGVAQETERWPGTRFALVGGAELQAAAGRMGLRVPVFADRAAATQEFAGLVVPATARVRIIPDRDAPSRARSAVLAFCDGQGIGGDGDAAQLVASELVTNAVVHAGTEIDLTLRLIMPILHIAVRDTGPGRPKIAGPIDESAESGRGLLLVDALASTWGTFFPDNGKIVWAQVRVRAMNSRP